MQVGPFLVWLKSPIRSFWNILQRLYPRLPVVDGGSIHDFHIELVTPRNLRKWWRPQVLFLLDGERVFEPFPKEQSFPLFEWGLNYSIATRAHRYCLLHSAVLERNGRALILPALPGSGKSTLSAALMHNGWRLLSDEFGILRPELGTLVPMPRAIPLKNESIEVIREQIPDAVIGPRYTKTRKGDVAHVAATEDSLVRHAEEVMPAWIVFPRYIRNGGFHLDPVFGSEAFVRLSNNSFNYRLLGEVSYLSLTSMVQSCDCYNLVYGDLDRAVEALTELAA